MPEEINVFAIAFLSLIYLYFLLVLVLILLLEYWNFICLRWQLTKRSSRTYATYFLSFPCFLWLLLCHGSSGSSSGSNPAALSTNTPSSAAVSRRPTTS